jgi:hypothetical protein
MTLKLIITVKNAKGKRRKVFEKEGEDSEIWKTAYELVFGKKKEKDNDKVEES